MEESRPHVPRSRCAVKSTSTSASNPWFRHQCMADEAKESRTETATSREVRWNTERGGGHSVVFLFTWVRSERKIFPETIGLGISLQSRGKFKAALVQHQPCRECRHDARGYWIDVCICPNSFLAQNFLQYKSRRVYLKCSGKSFLSKNSPRKYCR